ncbi:MAG: DUF2807 domain-containing protein [Saprospirales bacterium]|nr:MAG: DUF2807 domain-containing protein [Saprospirales bacterium]
MKNFSFLLLTLSVSMVSCQFFNQKTVHGDGEMSREARTIGEFTQLEVAGNFTVKHTLSSEPSLEINAEYNLMEHIKTELINGRLEISTPQNVRLRPKKDIEILLTGPKLEVLSLLGSGSVLVDKMDSEKVRVSLNGSGNLFSNLEAGKVEASLNGSGQITLDGEVPTADFSLNGSGTIRASGLSVGELKAGIRGSGEIFCNVISTLDASITGNGKVLYSGNPEVNERVTGSGKVVRN